MLVAEVFVLLADGINAAEIYRAYFKDDLIVNKTTLKLIGTGLFNKSLKKQILGLH